MAQEKGNTISGYFPSKAEASLFRAVVFYEAARRGVSAGQALCQLVDESVDEESYPRELRDYLREIDLKARECAEKRAVEAFMRESA